MQVLYSVAGGFLFRNYIAKKLPGTLQNLFYKQNSDTVEIKRRYFIYFEDNLKLFQAELRQRLSAECKVLGNNCTRVFSAVCSIICVLNVEVYFQLFSNFRFYGVHTLVMTKTRKKVFTSGQCEVIMDDNYPLTYTSVDLVTDTKDWIRFIFFFVLIISIN